MSVRRSLLGLLGVAAMVAAAPAHADPWHAPRPKLPVARSAGPAPGTRVLHAAQVGAGQLTIGVHDGYDASAVAAALRLHATSVRVIDALGVIVVDTADRPQLTAAARRDTRVAFVEAPAKKRALGYSAADVDPHTGVAYGWAVDAIGAAQARAITGPPVIPVAIVDTGVDGTHPDLAQSIVGAWDTVLNERDPYDLQGHGTFVAGMIAAADDGIGATGVIPGAPLLAVNAEDGEGSFDPVEVAEGIVWATDHGAAVINLSLGGPTPTEIERRALDYAYSQRVTVVAAAGNDGPGSVNYPAAYLGGYRGGYSPGISVAASTPDGTAAGFSTQNDYVTVAAPGAGRGQVCTDGDPYDGVYSTTPVAPSTIFPDEGCGAFPAWMTGLAAPYAYSEGTSFAAPIVAGVAAMVVQMRQGQLDADQVALIIKRTASGAGFWEESVGWGVVNAPAAVEYARRFDTTDPSYDLVRIRRTGARRATVRALAEDWWDGAEEPARGGIRYWVSVRGADGRWRYPVGTARRLAGRTVPLPSRGPAIVEVAACDGNDNCVWSAKRLQRWHAR